MQKNQSGFTLIELLVVISIIGVLAAVLLPKVLESKDAANAFADGRHLSDHAFWMERYQQQHRNILPTKGGHKFVLATWTSGVVPHDPENLDKFFTPGNQDPHYVERRREMEMGNNPWPDLESTSSEDTHYAGRAQQKIKTAMQSAAEAWMATDNENGWCLRDGTVNVLLNGGKVRSYSYPILKETFGLGDLDLNNPVVTAGPNSPIPECQSLDY